MARGDDIQSIGVVIDPVVSRQAVRVRLDVIDASERLREVSEAHAVVMAASMAERGQRTPIEIVRRGDRYRLVYGAHRYRGAEINGWVEIEAFIVEAGEAEVRLREIDENLIRHELTALDRARFLAERKRLYEAINPAAKHGGDRRSDQAANLATWSFGEDIAEKTGLSYRTIARAVALAEALSPEAVKRVRHTPLASNQAALEALAKQPHDRQAAALDLMFAEENPAKSVGDAFARLDGKVVKPATERNLAKLFDLWGRTGAKERREFLKGLMEAGDVPAPLAIVEVSK